MKNTLVIVLFFFLVNGTFGQKFIQGIVFDADSLPLIGATVEEINTINKTFTNVEGRFSLYIQSDTSCVKIAYIGAKDTVLCHLKPDISLRMKMWNDVVDFKPIVCIDIFKPDITSVGLYSGLLHNPFGMTFSNFSKKILKIPVNLNTGVDYKTDFNHNKELRIKVARYQSIRIKPLYLGFAYEYDCKKIDSQSLSFNYQANKFYTTWNLMKSYLFLGYGYSEFENEKHHGILTGVAFNIPKTKNVSISANANYWLNDLEYSVELSKYFSKIPISIAAGYEQLHKYKELNLKLAYQFKY